MTCSTKQEAFQIGEPSEISAARRAGNALCRALGFDEVRTGQVALVITEAATNIVKHAVRGQIILRAIEQDGLCGIDILAIDAGPGMTNAALQMQDGQSTAGTYGVGLGAIARLSHEFDYYTAPGLGVVLNMRLWSTPAAPPPPQWDCGVVCLPLAGETACGDAWEVLVEDGELRAVLADGLGHGPEAAAASEQAQQVLRDYPHEAPAQLLQRCHTAMRGTRGAALAVLSVDAPAGQLRFAGVGNIAACAFEGETRRHLLSHNGIVGSNLRKVQEFASPWVAGSMLVLNSDGLTTRWDLAGYPGLEGRRSGVIAGVLYRDFSRRNDDATVLVLRQRTGG